MGKIITDIIETNAGTDLVFTVGGAERMRIATNGKISTQGEFSTGGKVTSLVGNQKSEFSQIKSIGNTNSLQVGTNEVNSLTIGQIGGEYSGIGYNVNFDGSVNPPLLKFRGEDTASLLKFHNGGFQFLGTPTTGAANGTTPITFSSLMSIDKTGLVTIGRAGGPTTSLSVIGQAQSSIGTTAGSSANTLVTKDYVKDYVDASKYIFTYGRLQYSTSGYTDHVGHFGPINQSGHQHGGYDADLKNHFDIFPPAGKVMANLVAFIPSIAMIHFNGGVNSDDIMRCYGTIFSTYIRVWLQNTEQRSLPAANWLAIWKN